MSRRDKVRQAIKEEVSNILHDELKDPRLGFVTVTDVELSADLRHAKIFFSVLGKEQDYIKTQEALDSALGFIRRLVAERINLRFAPEIIFRQDRSSEYSSRIQQVLEEIKAPERQSVPMPEERLGRKRKERLSERKKGRRPHKKK